MNYLRERPLSPAADDLIQFDADSIRRLGGNPDVWLADPDQYEKNGRVLRDSESSRMLAYSTKDRILYATDGCNSCVRELPAKIEDLSADALKQFAEDNDLPLELLQRLARLVS
jgi:hypothetical protein